MPHATHHTTTPRWTAFDLAGLVEPVEIEGVREWEEARRAAADRLGIPVERVEATQAVDVTG